MEKTHKAEITVETYVDAPIEKVWECWTRPRHITHWYAASEDWHAPQAENDLKPGGRFRFRMEAKDATAGFDFSGIYEQVVPHKLITYRLDDDRKVSIRFTEKGSETKITETFEADSSHPSEMQRSGWQSILDNFKRYVESDP